MSTQSIGKLMVLIPTAIITGALLVGIIFMMWDWSKHEDEVETMKQMTEDNRETIYVHRIMFFVCLAVAACIIIGGWLADYFPRT